MIKFLLGALFVASAILYLGMAMAMLMSLVAAWVQP